MNDDAAAVLVHGLVVRSDVPLRQGRPAPDRPVDLVVLLAAAREQPDGDPAGQVLGAQQRPDGTPFYTAVRTGDGVLLRCHGVCDIDVAPAVDVVVVRPHPAAPPGLVEVVLGGMGLALVLYLRGHLVLHASAVEWRGSAVAVVGRSGMGKSTTAALLCDEGCRLVTDDVLRVDLRDAGALAHRGSAEVRIRPSSGLEAGAALARRVTSDDRLALALPEVAADCLPVGVVVVPYPDRSAGRLLLEPLGATDALVVLTAFPRLVGWSDPASTARRFDQTADLARRVPVVVATLPWGLPFPPGLAADLLERLSAQLGTPLPR